MEFDLDTLRESVNAFRAKTALERLDATSAGSTFAKVSMNFVTNDAEIRYYTTAPIEHLQEEIIDAIDNEDYEKAQRYIQILEKR